jgi:hypothetical protein
MSHNSALPGPIQQLILTPPFIIFLDLFDHLVDMSIVFVPPNVLVVQVCVDVLSGFSRYFFVVGVFGLAHIAVFVLDVGLRLPLSQKDTYQLRLLAVLADFFFSCSIPVLLVVFEVVGLSKRGCTSSVGSVKAAV